VPAALHGALTEAIIVCAWRVLYEIWMI